MKCRTLLLASLILLPSCATNGLAPSPCGPFRPILISAADVLTTETARDILVHNEVGVRLCAWR